MTMAHAGSDCAVTIETRHFSRGWAATIVRRGPATRTGTDEVGAGSAPARRAVSTEGARWT
jgi:hypothetical protein